MSMGAVCEVHLEATDTGTFSKSEITVQQACRTIMLSLNHAGKLPKTAMGHNWVLSKSTDVSEILSKAKAAGFANEYQFKDSSKIIASTKLLSGGESDTITFDVSRLNSGTSYTFFCSVPGHTKMIGKFVVQDTTARMNS